MGKLGNILCWSDMADLVAKRELGGVIWLTTSG